MKSKALFLALLALVGSVLACATPTPISTYTSVPLPTATPPPPPTATPTPLPTDTPTPTPLPTEAAATLLDVCTLLTPDEVEAALGSPVTVQPAPETGNCSYVAESSAGEMPATVALGAGHGEEGKAIIVVGVAILTFFTGGSEAAQADFERLQSDLPDMTMQDVVTELAHTLESVGFEITPYEGVGDLAYWLWYEGEGVSIGELIIVQGESWLTVAVVGQPQDAALATIDALAGTALERLPPAFSVLPAGE
jgi:hypothetical protein